MQIILNNVKVSGMSRPPKRGGLWSIGVSDKDTPIADREALWAMITRGGNFKVTIEEVKP